ncbi:MAG: chemotaxis protein CheB [Cyanobacteria bacterium J06632_3]
MDRIDADKQAHATEHVGETTAPIERQPQAEKAKAKKSRSKKSPSKKSRSKKSPSEQAPDKAKLNETPLENDAPKISFPVVGIGASAGGLRALEDFFDNLPPNGGAAYVIIQHLSPDFKSLMKELLSQRTRMNVRRVTDGMKLEPNTIFLIPPGQNLRLQGDALHLTSQERDLVRHQPHFPIDLFFQSLAKECKEKAIGIILSGTGSDGTQGIQAISELGGIVMVQTPEDAEFDGMPRSAIATSLTDLVLPVDELARTTHQLVTSPNQRQELQQAAPNQTQIEKIISILDRHENIDFTQYKLSTVKRRINRRCMIAGYSNLEQYIEQLERSPHERTHLQNDMLITVTHFLRDPQAWQHIKTEVLPSLIKQAEDTRVLRIWVTACATGEEAYSIGILLKELIGSNPHGIETKIFATDIDPVALAKASAGIYSAATMRNLSQEQIDRFFTARGDRYEVTKALREMIIFANHNLTKDAGFTQIDLVSCRNVLIYMQPELQRHVLRNLHFSLKKDSFLFLGESENLGDLQKEFTIHHQTWKIYQKLRDVRLPLVDTYLSKARLNRKRLESLRGAKKTPRFDPLLAAAFKALLKERDATCFLVDRDNKLLHLCGDALHLLRLADGRASQDILKLVPEALELPLNTALHRARQQDSSVRYNHCTINDDAYNVSKVSLEVSQQKSATAGTFLLVMIEAQEDFSPTDIPEQFSADEDTAQYILQLQQELQSNRENLQATV